MPHHVKDIEHVHFRTTPELKQSIAAAAALCGQTITLFIETAALERAQEVLARQTLVLSQDERDRFLAALQAPAAPSAALMGGAKRTLRAAETGELG